MSFAYIKLDKLKSGEIKEYCILNQHFEWAEELQSNNQLAIDHIDKDHVKRIGLTESYTIWKLSGCVGAIWLDKAKQFPLVVKPKIDNIDAVKMYLKLASHAALFSSYQQVFKCWPEEPTIEGKTLPDVTLLQIAVFLKELSYFCQRDLRQGFIRVRQNLTGKVKGKILIGENIRQNTLHARDDKMVCQFHLLSLDTPANRILKAALMRCYRYLGNNQTYPLLLQWARQCYAALSDVSDETINDSDFRSIVDSGLMRKYQRPHQYARMILKRLRTDASGQILETSTVPFVLDMNRLFEGYVGVLLAEKGMIFTAQENQRFGGDAFSVTIRPDFHTQQEGIVVDAKYKSILTYQAEDDTEAVELISANCLIENAKPSNADVYQVIAYCNFLNASYKNKPFKKAILAVPANNEVVTAWSEPSKPWINKEIPRLEIDGITIYILPCPVPITQSTQGGQ